MPARTERGGRGSNNNRGGNRGGYNRSANKGGSSTGGTTLKTNNDFFGIFLGNSGNSGDEE
jgi:hypothetical protein